MYLNVENNVGFFYVFHPLLSVTGVSWLASEMHHSEPSEMVMDSHVGPTGLWHVPPRRMTHSALWTANAASKQPAQYEETGHTWKTDALAARWPCNPGVRITLALPSCNGNGEEGAACYQNKSASTDWGDKTEIRVYFLIPTSFFVFLF